jgi:hypothetical protein
VARTGDCSCSEDGERLVDLVGDSDGTEGMKYKSYTSPPQNPEE